MTLVILYLVYSQVSTVVSVLNKTISREQSSKSVELRSDHTMRCCRYSPQPIAAISCYRSLKFQSKRGLFLSIDEHNLYCV